MGVEVNNNGEIIIWATAHVIEGKGRCGAILKLNSQGDSLWAHYYQGPNHVFHDLYQLNDLVITDDGGFFGVGYKYIYNSGKVKAWIFKTNASGVIGWEEQPPFESLMAQIYPNPAQDYTNVVFEEALKSDAEIKVYNSLGALVLQKHLAKNKKDFNLNLQGFCSGVYFYVVSDGIESLVSGRFLVE
jgi:hypothetical protein